MENLYILKGNLTECETHGEEMVYINDITTGVKVSHPANPMLHSYTWLA